MNNQGIFFLLSGHSREVSYPQASWLAMQLLRRTFNNAESLTIGNSPITSLDGKTIAATFASTPATLFEIVPRLGEVHSGLWVSAIPLALLNTRSSDQHAVAHGCFHHIYWNQSNLGFKQGVYCWRKFNNFELTDTILISDSTTPRTVTLNLNPPFRFLFVSFPLWWNDATKSRLILIDTIAYIN